MSDSGTTFRRTSNRKTRFKHMYLSKRILELTQLGEDMCSHMRTWCRVSEKKEKKDEKGWHCLVRIVGGVGFESFRLRGLLLLSRPSLRI